MLDKLRSKFSADFRRQQERQELHSRLLGRIEAVLPELTQGDHTLAQYLSQPRFLRLDADQSNPDLLNAVGGMDSAEIFRIRLYGNRERQIAHLQAVINSRALNREVVLAWEGSGLNPEGDSSFYVNVVGEVDVKVDWSDERLVVSPGYPPYGPVYVLTANNFYPDFEGKNGVRVSQVGLDNDLVAVTFTSGERVLNLTAPARINQVNFGALA